MEMENTLAQNLSVAGENAFYDEACKRLLANKIILAWLMKSCLEEYRDIEVNEIAETYIEGEPQIARVAVHPDEMAGRGEQIKGGKTEDSTITEGTITFDIRFQAWIPGTKESARLFVNVEAQNDFYPGYPIVKRGLYYCSRLISSQYGTEFTNAHYERIKKVSSIWICLNPPKYRKNTINRYTIQEEHLIGEVSEKKENYDLMTAVIICLGNFADKRYTGILKLLDVLLSSEKEAEEKKKILQNDFDIKMTRELEREVSDLCNLSKDVEEKGMKKGIKKGMKEGIKEGILTSIQNLMESMNWTAEQAMEALKVPKAEWSQYESRLKM